MVPNVISCYCALGPPMSRRHPTCRAFVAICPTSPRNTLGIKKCQHIGQHRAMLSPLALQLKHVTCLISPSNHKLSILRICFAFFSPEHLLPILCKCHRRWICCNGDFNSTNESYGRPISLQLSSTGYGKSAKVRFAAWFMIMVMVDDGWRWLTTVNGGSINAEYCRLVV